MYLHLPLCHMKWTFPDTNLLLYLEFCETKEKHLKFCFFKKYISHTQANAVKQKWNFIALAMHTQITQAQNWLFLHLFLPVSLLSFTQDHSMCMPCCDFLCKQFPVTYNQVCFAKSLLTSSETVFLFNNKIMSLRFLWGGRWGQKLDQLSPHRNQEQIILE